MTANTHIKKRRSLEQWQALVEQQQQSNQSARQFCEDNRIGCVSFCKWRQRILAPDIDHSDPDSAPQFIDLGALASRSPGSWNIVLKLGNGVELCLNQAHVST